MIINNIKPFKLNEDINYVNVNFPVNSEQIKDIIKNIPLTRINKGLNDLIGDKYKLSAPMEKKYLHNDVVIKLPNKLSKILISKFYKEFPKVSPKECNDINICSVIKKDIRLLKVDKRRGVYIIEGQILFVTRHVEFIIRFIISGNTKIYIHNLKLDGLGFSKSNPGYDPLTSKYAKPKSTLISLLGSDLLGKNTNKKQAKYPYKCYGKTAYSKYECESKYNNLGELNNNIGVWDKRCNTNTECPFYKQNKNYTNTFGGCTEGTCEMPLGTTSISPTKFIDKNTIVCGNCKTGYYCCGEQINSKLYPGMKSPDYRFKNDLLIRSKNNL